MSDVSNRDIAKKLNSSIRPIYYQFKNSEELNKELVSKIEHYFFDYKFNLVMVMLVIKILVIYIILLLKMRRIYIKYYL